MKIKVFTLFSIVFILLGCRDYNSLQPTSISSVTDFMKFTSSVDFKNQIDKLKNLSPEQLKKWNDSTVILSILDMKNDNYSTGGRVSVDSSQLALYDEMLDPIFASILNKNGEFSVGDLFIRVTPDIVFMSTFDKIDKVRALDPFAFLNIQPNKTIIQDGIKIGRVYHERTSLAGGRTLFNGVDHTIYDWDDRHRSATVIYNDNWLIYKSIGCKVKFQNKRWWGGWWQDDTDALYMSYDVVYDISTLPTIVDLRHVSPPARSCTNCGLIDNYIDGSTLSIGIGESGFTADLIDSPFDFKYFIANSQVTWRGNVHSDALREDQ